MFFRNLVVFRIPETWQPTAEELRLDLEKRPFKPCGAMEARAMGWTPPREDGPLVQSVNRQHLLALCVEEKKLSSATVKAEAHKRAKVIENEQGRKVGRKEIRDLRDRITEEFMPRVFPKQRLTFVWIDVVNHWLVVDGSIARADEVVEVLQHSVEGIGLRRLQTAVSPSSAMTGWVADGEAPSPFTVDQDLELRSAAEAQAAIRYVRHSLEGGEIKQHIASGKIAIKLALTWNDRISFVLSDKLEMKRLAFLDILREQAEQNAETADEQFDADFALMAGELARLFADLVAGLGGETKP